jgi:hypothetical protein
MRRTPSLRSAARFSAIAMATAMVTGCAQLHLTQGPDQVIQRTENQDNYDVKQVAGPTAARVLPYALLSEQAYDSRVYAKHRIAPRATDCISDDAQNCDTLRDSRRVAAWLDQWRYVWSCDGPKECEVRISGQNEPVGGLGVQIWARKGKPCSEGVIAFRGTAPSG